VSRHINLHNAPEDALAAWMRRAEDENVQSLETLPEAVAAYAAEHAPSGMPSEAERKRAIRIGVAEVQRQNASWTRAKLRWEIHRALPMLPADVDPVPYLEALADEALSGRAEGVTVIQIAPGARRGRHLAAGSPQGRHVGLPAPGRGPLCHRRAPGP
jgi:hypothetical protein